MNTATTHTPGPWRAFRGGGVQAKKWFVRFCNGERCPTVALMKAGNGACSRDEQEANAHLIAAAPALLAALENIMRTHTFAPQVEEEARAAIAQARGTA